MSNDTTKTKLPQLAENVEEIPAADLDDVAGGLLEGDEKCNGTCKETKVSLSSMA
jgi:hypothetical protein